MHICVEHSLEAPEPAPVTWPLQMLAPFGSLATLAYVLLCMFTFFALISRRWGDLALEPMEPWPVPNYLHTLWHGRSPPPENCSELATEND